MSEKEGEIKKRSLLTSEIVFEDKFGEMDLSKARWLSIDVLDEAKKDFPKYNSILYNQLKTKVDPASATILQHHEFIGKIYQWFEKWFGSSEKL